MNLTPLSCVWVAYLWNDSEQRWLLAAFLRGHVKLTVKRTARLRRKLYRFGVKSGVPILFMQLDHAQQHGPPNMVPQYVPIPKVPKQRKAPKEVAKVPRAIDPKQHLPLVTQPSPRSKALSAPLLVYSIHNVTYGPRIVQETTDEVRD